MKTILLVFLLLSTSALACLPVGKPRDVPDGVIEAKLSSVFEPTFDSNVDPKIKHARVEAVLNLSSKGIVERIVNIKIEPSTLPQEPIIKAIRKSKFLPKTDDKKPVESIGFRFHWEFEVTRLPKFKIEIEY
ncbi:hypothetical protein [Aliikangiella coralliicola]|uniref:TonB C-terminal domain-containing protein n=1 Tax=Aliikangiella coralliicola TaxID=2592383 RepID=A0A545UG41_9GAMM|nr:hypothetical protein [Aliikangiella coralliicola]TQV88405.1 hypothetical protein FLL46_07740 [Aliikangiella coralliicola]